MGIENTRSGGEGLERSCKGAVAGWLASSTPVEGVELFRASLTGEVYQKHRHDTYAVGVTDRGVQVFDYRGAARVSLPGQIVVLYPDEAHDGRAGTADGFGYRIVYVEPSQLADALRTIRGRPCPLPFVADPVSTSAGLSRAIDAAFRLPMEPVAGDSLVVDLAERLLGAERADQPRGASRRVDAAPLERARRFLDAERTRVVHSAQLESVTALT